MANYRIPRPEDGLDPNPDMEGWEEVDLGPACVRCGTPLPNEEGTWMCLACGSPYCNRCFSDDEKGSLICRGCRE